MTGPHAQNWVLRTADDQVLEPTLDAISSMSAKAVMSAKLSALTGMAAAGWLR